MKKKIYLLLLMSLISVTILFSACKSDDPKNVKTSPSATIVATKAPTPPTSTPTSTASESSPTAEPTSEGKNLMYFALEEDSLEPSSGNQWGPVVSDKWTGPCWDRKIEEVEINGEYVDCLYVTHNATDTTGNNIGNVFGVAEIIEPNKTYKFTVTLKYTDPTDPADANYRDLMYITCNAAKENVAAVDNRGSGLPFHASEKWQTFEYTFTTGATMPEYIENDVHAQEPYIMVGPSCNCQRFYGEVSSGMELWISDVSLVEVVK